MRFSFQSRLYPAKPQVEFLDRGLRAACWLYHAARQERDDAWKTCRKSIHSYDQAKQLQAMRADGCLSLANYSCGQDGLRRVDPTYQAFLARMKRGEKPGFPRYRWSRRYHSIPFPSYGDGCRRLDTGQLRIQGAGHIQLQLHRPVEGTIQTVTIKREAGRGFAGCSVERDRAPLEANDRATGIDVGRNRFAVLSHGTERENPRH